MLILYVGVYCTVLYMYLNPLCVWFLLQIFTMPEFLKKRFESQWVRTYLTVVALISYVFTKFSVSADPSVALQSNCFVVLCLCTVLCYSWNFLGCFQVDIYAGSLFLYEAVGWNLYWSALCIMIITAVYTLLGKQNTNCKCLCIIIVCSRTPLFRCHTGHEYKFEIAGFRN